MTILEIARDGRGNLLNIRTTRRRLHRQLTSNGLKGRDRVLRRILWDCWRATLAEALSAFPGH